VVDVALVQGDLQRGLAAGGRLVERVAGLALVAGRAVEQVGDGGGHQLDVADLLGADPVHEVAVRLGVAAEIEALEQVLHHRPHLAELVASPSWRALAAAGSGSSGTISLMSRWTL
jgi:hypothetical protein